MFEVLSYARAFGVYKDVVRRVRPSRGFRGIIRHMTLRGSKRKAPVRRVLPRPASARLKLLPDILPDYTRRLARLREKAVAAGLGWTLITNPLDVAYLTGFLGGDSYLLLGPSVQTVISDFRYEEELAPVRALASIHIRTGAIAGAVGEVFAALNVDRCAVQPEHLTLAQRDAIARAAGPRELVPVPRLTQDLRVIKDESEVRLIRQAIRIQEAALLALLPTLRPGQTEEEVAARLECEMKSRGSREPGFNSIIAARAKGSLPHYHPGRITLAANQPLLIDWGATYRGYHGDMTRTFALGRWPAKVREVYEIVLEAHERAAQALAPGVSSRDVDAAARRHITDAGYGDRFGHGLGHGLGLQGHDEPSLSHIAPPVELKPGMVVTIEPGIYLPGIGGVRIEDDYLITPTGRENLCSLPKDLAWATL